MTERSRFFNSYGADVRQYSAADFAEVFKRFLANGVIRDVANELAVSAGAGVSVNVDTGEAMVKGYWYQNDASLNVALAAPDATNPRIDRIVVRLDLTAAVRLVTVEALTGVPAGSPSAPALTQNGTTWEESLAQVQVAAVTGALTITDERTKVSAGGEEWLYAESSTTPNGSAAQFAIGAGSGVASKKVRVYVNGLLRPSSDYTHTEGSSTIAFTAFTPLTDDKVWMEYVAV